jgi:hypothetical protein
MAVLSRLTTWNKDESITPSSLNNEFGNVVNTINNLDTGATVWDDVVTKSLSFSPTTGGIVGTTAADNASSGIVGEYISTSVNGVAAGATGVLANIATISLTAGDWDVTGGFNAVTGTDASVANMVCSLSLFSGALTTDAVTGYNYFNVYQPAVAANTQIAFTIPNFRVNISTTMTVYLKGSQSYTAGSPTWFGNITARRRR